jgi:DNA-binding LytR/AlgR family response regulator
MKPNVLILEDNFLLCADIADLVAERLNATPVMASSVAKALKLVPDDIAFAFLDIDVLDGESYPVAQKLMENEIPLVFVSGKDKHLLPDEFRDVPFVSKPATPRILVQLAKSLSSAFG